MLRILITGLLLACSLPPAAASRVAVEIDLQGQRAYLLRNGHVALTTPVSTGRAGFRTPTGRFRIIQKDLRHTSSIYGRIIDRYGHTLVADADIDMRVPAGGKFVAAPMHYFMRFSGPNGMHAGYLPGYAASHGCVRLPKDRAIAFYHAVDIGTPVTILKRIPARRNIEWRGYAPFHFAPFFERRPRGSGPFGWW